MVMNRGCGIIKGLSVRVERDVVLRRLKVRPGAFDGSGPIGPLLEGTVAEGYGLIAPAAVYATLRIDTCGEGVVTFIDSAFSIPGEKVAELLRPCVTATLMAATIGSSLPAETVRLMDAGRMTEAMILDAFGSEAADEAVNVLCGMLRKDGARERLVMTRRFSPGYGDWPITEQRRILDVCNAGRIGVGVSPESILVPEKSVTAVAGWLKTVQR